jgi:hypothetical protein
VYRAVGMLCLIIYTGLFVVHRALRTLFEYYKLGGLLWVEL